MLCHPGRAESVSAAYFCFRCWSQGSFVYSVLQHPANLALSIITGDEKALTCAQGIGKKIAQRVILELKDKLAKGQALNGAGEPTAAPE